LRISLVVAVSRNRVIGRDNQLPWRLPADLAFFKRVTMGHPVIMGRRTWESLKKPLPGRENIVVTRNKGYEAPGSAVANSLEAALALCADEPIVFVIGGSQLFAESLPIADRIYLTEVDAVVEGDIFLPEFDRSQWTETPIEYHAVDERHALPFRIVQLDRRR